MRRASLYVKAVLGTGALDLAIDMPASTGLEGDLKRSLETSQSCRHHRMLLSARSEAYLLVCKIFNQAEYLSWHVWVALLSALY